MTMKTLSLLLQIKDMCKLSYSDVVKAKYIVSG